MCGLESCTGNLGVGVEEEVEDVVTNRRMLGWRTIEGEACMRQDSRVHDLAKDLFGILPCSLC